MTYKKASIREIESIMKLMKKYAIAQVTQGDLVLVSTPQTYNLFDEYVNKNSGRTEAEVIEEFLKGGH